ncbi:MAG TPA: hypothetical protein VG759_10865 [Candidatus Angelobacter sp.]|nr:hypothetical protein [Candidatus Angelobacter sp.]
MIGKARTGDLRKDTSKLVVSPGAKLDAEAAVRMAKLMERGRRYTMQVKVTDPEGRDVFTLTRLTSERDLRDQGDTVPEIDEILELLIEAANEYVLPFE